MPNHRRTLRAYVGSRLFYHLVSACPAEAHAAFLDAMASDEARKLGRANKRLRERAELSMESLTVDPYQYMSVAWIYFLCTRLAPIALDAALAKQVAEVVASKVLVDINKDKEGTCTNKTIYAPLRALLGAEPAPLHRTKRPRSAVTSSSEEEDEEEESSSPKRQKKADLSIEFDALRHRLAILEKRFATTVS